jgi:subtilisin-like proprotein convertase family protein
LALARGVYAAGIDPEPRQRPPGGKESELNSRPITSFPAIIGVGAIAAPQAPSLILYDQTDSPNANAFSSQNFESIYDAYDSQAADDFVVTGSGWSVTTVVTPGVYFNGAGPAASLHVTFYEDAGGLPGTVVAGCDYPAVTKFSDVVGSFTATLTPACTLSPGHKWVSVQVNMNFVPAGQWGWTMRDVLSFDPSVWRNPGGGFPGGCLTFTPRGVCDPTTAGSPDQAFRLDGNFAGCTVSADCQDGNLCNGAEICKAGLCTPGTPVDCSDGLFCTTDTCDPSTGACGHSPNPCGDGDSCTLDFCSEANDACTHVSPPPIHLCNTGAISIPDSGTATPYPSTISVSGLSTSASVCSVELLGIAHTFPSDIDTLVVGPGTPQNAIVMSDAGGGSAVTGVNLVLKDAAALSIPTPLVSGTFKPTNVGAGDPFPGAPAPTGGSALSAFDGTDPNGDWNLYIVDDAGGDVGTVAGGWCVNLVVSGCSTDSQCGDGNLCNGVETCVGGTCTPGTSIDCDDGLFCTTDTCDPSSGACGHPPDPCSDGNSCTVDSCDEAGDVCVNTNASVHFCNTAAISIPSSGASAPYPSPIVISGLPTVGSVCSVELHGITHTYPDDIDILLARLSGANALILSDVGGSGAVTGVNLELKDSAAASLPDGPPLVSGSFRPTNFNTGGADSAFPAPAPAISGPSALSTFDGGDPNGTWNLWVRDEFPPDSGVISGGWCLNLVVSACTTDAECNDGNVCTGVETCVAGSCTPGTPVICSDGLFCTTDTCDPATGTCAFPPDPCGDGDACTLDFCDEANDACTHVTPPPVHICNTGAISIPDSGTGTPYPSTITISGLSTTASLCSVELKGIGHTFPSDIDMLLVGPGTPQNAIVMSDVGGSSPVTDINLTLKDAAALSIPTPLVSGTFKPTNVGAGDAFIGAPAPTGGSALSAFDGSNPNGNWNLYVVDDLGGDAGTVNGGWCVNFVVSACTTDAECNDGNACNGVETCVASTCTPGVPVDCNDGLFCTTDTCDPSTGTCGHGPAACSDGDSCTLDACDEANDLCTHLSPQQIHLCNTDAISIPDSGTGTPYPSTITASGLSTTASLCSVELKGIGHTFPSDIDILLVGPGTPQNAVVMSDAGGGTPVTDINLTLKDAAALSIPTPLVSGTFKPTNVGAGDLFPGAPAPTGGSALSAFDGSNPNGDWNLYLVDDAGGDVGTVAGGWCVNFVVDTCTADAECSDGNLCNGTETCVAGTCTPGTSIDCNDGLFCTIDTCAPSTGTCGHTPNLCDDGDACSDDSCDEAGDVCVHNSASCFSYDQTDFPNPFGFNSQNFEAAYDAYDNQLADDFVVTGSGWVVSTVTTPGAYFNGAGPAPSLHVTFYADAGGLPGAVVSGCDYPAVTTFTDNLGSFTTTLTPPCTLSPGPKWVSVQVNMAFLAGGQWGWTMRDVLSFNPSVWRNPGGGFPGGCFTYTPRGVCEPTTAASPDQAFRLDGSLFACTVDADCQDANLCNGVESCVASACSPGTPVDCGDGLFCTTDSCDPAKGTCGHAPNLCSDGDACTQDSCDEANDACTHVTPQSFHVCNTGAISIPDSGTGTPYPSTIAVSGLSTSASVCSVELLGIGHTFPSDIDMLLVGPGTPQNALVMSDVGGSIGVTGVNLTLKDGAALSIPTPLVSGTFKPTNVGAGDAFIGAPAPTGGSALSVFNGTNPNGDWKLYVVDDLGGDLGTVAGGWCVNLVVSACTVDAECNDGNACNGVETCVASACAPGTPIDCNDGLFCTTDTCAPATGTCGHTPNPCSDGRACTVDSCDETKNLCVNDSSTCVTYDQTDFQNPFGFTSQNFEAAYDAYDNQSADDFVVTGAGWAVSTVVSPGEYFNGTGPAQSVHVTFYDDAGGLPGAVIAGGFPGTVVTGCDYPAVTTFIDDGKGNLTTTLQPPCNLSPGPKWVSVQVNMDFGAGGQWGWKMRDVLSFNPSVWRNPGGGFGFGCQTYTARGVCAPDTAASPDQSFLLEGNYAGCTLDADCQDGNLCNGVESCVAGACTPGTPVNCGDGLFCTSDTCDPATGTCGHTPNLCSDGDTCTQDSCDEANDACTHLSPQPIHLCNTGAISIPDSGTATPYPSTITVSGLSTSASVCSVELLGISHTFPSDIDMLVVGPGTPQNAIVMSDVGGSVGVTGIDLTLKDGAALSIPTPLVSGTFKPTNLGGGDAFPGAPAPTGGSALSVFSGTNPNGDWQLYVVDGFAFDVGTVAGGWCVNLVVSAACSGDAECNDNNVCTTDTCNPATGCVNTNNTNPCNDGNACTTNDTCGGGTCNGGSPPVCNDNNVCTTDTCSPASGCVFTNNTNPCNDGNACTTNDTCGGGTCNGGAPPVCNDNNACTTDTCSPASGCVFTNNTNPCDDGNACTTNDTCGGGTCTGGAPPVCNDGNVCTTDTCSPATGCVFTNNTNPCNDGAACTTNDTCGGGTCSGTPVVCAPEDQCQEAGICNPGSGECSYAAKPNGTTCDDGSTSTWGDSCRNGVCTGTSCTSSNDPKTKGWYKSLCQNAHSGDSLTDADAACVGALTTRFLGITTVSEVCAILEPSHPNADNCGKAEDQLMTLALNICKQRVCPSNALDSACGNNASVAQSLAESDAIFADPYRTDAECDHAECLDREINNGHALELDTLRIAREAGSVRLNWTAPTLDDGTGAPRNFKIWRRATGSVAPFVLIGTTPNVTFLDATAGTGSWQYDVTFVY